MEWSASSLFVYLGDSSPENVVVAPLGSRAIANTTRYTKTTAAAAIVWQLQRTGNFVRHALGTRIGGTAGPLETSLYVKETGTGNTGWVGK